MSSWEPWSLIISRLGKIGLFLLTGEWNVHLIQYKTYLLLSLISTLLRYKLFILTDMHSFYLAIFFSCLNLSYINRKIKITILGIIIFLTRRSKHYSRQLHIIRLFVSDVQNICNSFPTTLFPEYIFFESQCDCKCFSCIFATVIVEFPEERHLSWNFHYLWYFFKSSKIIKILKNYKITKVLKSLRR